MKINKIKTLAAATAALMVLGMTGPVLNVRADEVRDEHFLNIGSVSKMYVTTAVMQLKDRGLVDLDAPVTDYITDFTMADERYKDITVRMLMNHTSGLMGSVYFDAFRFGDASSDYHDSFLGYLSTQRLKADPGAYNCYCNDGFTLLEILVERVSGMTFSDYLQEYICEPLGVSLTGDIRSMEDMNGQIPYYTSSGIQMAPECPQLIGAGGIMSTSDDLCAFGASFFYGDETLLTDDSKREMAMSYNISGGDYEWGLGWDTTSVSDYENAGVSVLIKGGDTNSQHAALVVAPEEEISIAVISSGGGSGFDEEMALDLMDIALEEQGITVEHPEDDEFHTVDQVPEEYMQYEGVYSNGGYLMSITFPEGRYMSIESLTYEEPFVEEYMYTEEGLFAQMVGDVDSGTATLARNAAAFDFQEIDGNQYIIAEDGTASAVKMNDPGASESAQTAWGERSGNSYYLVSAGASDTSYATLPRTTLTVSDDAPGYVNGCTIIDETHAMNLAYIPSMASRDINDLEITEVDGAEYLSWPGQGYVFISEDSIPEFTDEVSDVALTTGEASWYRLDGIDNVTVTLDLPEGSSCYIYDQYGNVVYSSFMIGYGNTVPLPAYGMIVFVGSSGTTAHIGR